MRRRGPRLAQEPQRLLALLALVGAVDVLVVAVGADDHGSILLATVQVSPELNSLFRSPLPRFLRGGDLVVEQLVVPRAVDGAEHADRLGELGVAHAAEQVGQARLGGLLVVEQQIVLARCPCPARRPPASMPFRRMPLSRFLPKISGLPCSSSSVVSAFVSRSVA